MSDINQINYQPLTGMRHATKSAFKASLKTPGGKSAIILTATLVAIGVLTMSVVFIAIILFAYSLYIGYLSQSYRNGLWQAFAAANGWPLDTTTSVIELIPPSMQFGHSPHFSPIIQAQLGDLPCDLFSYNTTVGEGKYRHTYAYTVARMPLPATLPHLLLLSKKAGAELQPDLSNKQDVQLEGDFNDYFKLQIEQGQQIDALTVITPDVMQTLVQYSQAEDIEILGGDLYFMMGMDNRGPDRIQHLIESAVALGRQIIENIEHEQVPTQPAVSLQPQGADPAPS